MPFKCPAAICVIVVAFVCGGSSSLTTICVEIKPSRPQEEPYLMCKGAELPSYSQSNWPLTRFGIGSGFKQLTAPTFIDSNSPNPSGIPQLTPASMYNGMSQSFQPPTDYSYPSSNDNNNNNNYRLAPLTPTEKYESGLHSAPLQQPQQQFFSLRSQVANEAPPSTPSATDAQTYDNGDGKGYQPPSSPATPTTQPSASFTTQSPAVVYAAPAVRSQPQPQPYPYQVPSPYNNGAHFSASLAAGQQPSAHTGYGDQQRPQQRKQHQQPNSSGGGSDRSYASPSPAAALSGAEAEKPFAPQTVHVGRGEIPPAITPESDQRTATASAVVGNAASTATITAPAPGTATAGYVAPAAAAAAASLKAGADDFGSSEQYTIARGGYSESQPANTAISSVPAGVGEQRYRELIDENVQGMPDLEFTSEEFDLYRPMSDAAHIPTQARTIITEPVQPYWPQPDYGERVLPQLRTIPMEHMDDPVMRQFYASLHDPPATLLTAQQFVTHTAAHPQPLLGQTRSYSSSQLPSSFYPAEAGVAGYVCTSPVSVQSLSTPTPPAPTQHSSASDYMDSTQLPPMPADKQCNSCQSREYSFTPIIIALPCYGQPPSLPPSPSSTVVYGDRFRSPYTYGEFPATDPLTSFGEVSMANPMLGAYPSPQAMSAGGGEVVGSNFGGMGLFGGPRLFPPFGLVRPLFGGGLLGSMQSRPQFYQMRSNNGDQVVNDIVPKQHQSVMANRARGENTPTLTTAYSNNPMSKETTVSTATVATTIMPKSTVTTESASQTDSNESGESIEELKDKAKSEEASSASQEQQAATSTTRPRVAKVTAEMEPALGDTLVTPELPPNLGEEATKTFKTMMQAARTLTNIHKGEKDTTAYAENSKSNQDQLTKDLHAKATSTRKPNADW